MKISYNTKAWSKTGTVYRQRISMTEREFDAICDAIRSERALGFPQRDKYSHECVAVLQEYFEIPKLEVFHPPYANSPAKVSFLTLTQTRYLDKFAELRGKLKTDRYNTYIIIKN